MGRSETDLETMEWLRTIFRLYSRTASHVGLRGLGIVLFTLFIFGLFIVPLPPRALDILLVVNLLLALTLLLRGLFVSDVLSLHSFPSILLLATVYRLALNVSSTRLILLHGDTGLDAAGQVIQSFGTFVVQGDFVVGAIVFCIIATVNFIVIAKGSARVAEVAARFTLDALPGKQMAIDAELRAGRLTAEEAQRRRDRLAQESQFFGSMDGSMKFVQGDAVAGLVITFINAVGGISLGLSRGLSFSDAVDTFGILTIGDGLVSILPSLLISAAAGIIVTHVAGERKETRGTEAMFDVLAEPTSLVIAATALLVFSLLPGLPLIPFLIVCGIVIPIALLKSSKQPFRVHGIAGDALAVTTTATAEVGRLGYWPESVERQALGMVRPLVVRCSARIFENGPSANELDETIERTRRDVTRRWGVPLPRVEFEHVAEGDLGGYAVFVRENRLASGALFPHVRFVNCPARLVTQTQIPWIEQAIDPLSGLLGVWVPENVDVDTVLEPLGYRSRSVVEYLVEVAYATAIDNSEELFGISEVRRLLDEVKRVEPGLFEEVFHPASISVPEYTELLRRLLREGVSVRDQKLILNGVAEYISLNGSREERAELLQELHSYVRRVLARSIVEAAGAGQGSLHPFVLGTDVEEEFRSAVSMWDGGRTKPPLESDVEESLRASASKLFTPVIERGKIPIVILCSSEIRAAVHEVFGRQFFTPRKVRALSYDEVGTSTTVESVGMLTLS